MCEEINRPYDKWGVAIRYKTSAGERVVRVHLQNGNGTPRCQYCGTEYEEYDEVCPNCGFRLGG